MDNETEAVGLELLSRVAWIVEQDASYGVNGLVCSARDGHVVVWLEGGEAFLEPLLEHEVRAVHAGDLMLGQQTALVGLVAEQQPGDVRVRYREIDGASLDVCQRTRKFEDMLHVHHVPSIGVSHSVERETEVRSEAEKSGPR